MKRIIILSVSTISFFSCNTTNDTLTKYYNSNKELHHVLADSLIVFAKKYHTNEVVMRKRLDINNGQVFFSYFIQTNEPIRIGIQFDSALKRTDPYPEITSKTIIPIEIIKLFKKSMYTALIADSTEVFFGYKDSFDGNSKYGIVIDRDSTDNTKRHIQKLARNVYITKGVIP